MPSKYTDSRRIYFTQLHALLKFARDVAEAGETDVSVLMERARPLAVDPLAVEFWSDPEGFQSSLKYQIEEVQRQKTNNARLAEVRRQKELERQEKFERKMKRLKIADETKKVAANTKKLGKFKSRRLKNFPDYIIDENGHVVGPAGTELKYRWNAGKPYVRMEGKDRSVYWLLVEADFEEHPDDKRKRRAAAKAETGGYNVKQLLKCYNDEAEAIAEDPELFGDPNNPVGLTPQGV